MLLSKFLHSYLHQVGFENKTEKKIFYERSGFLWRIVLEWDLQMEGWRYYFYGVKPQIHNNRVSIHIIMYLWNYQKSHYLGSPHQLPKLGYVDGLVNNYWQMFGHIWVFPKCFQWIRWIQ